MNFILNRDHVLATTLGHCVEFVKDKPTLVPKALHDAVMAIGALPEDPDAVETKTESSAPEGAKREEEILTAIEVMVDRNERTDFGANGRPAIGPLSVLLGWKPSAAEVAALWARFQADKGE